MTDYISLLTAIQADPRYQANLDWGKPRQGHPEGAIRAHIAELEQNLKALSHKLTRREQDQLRVLIHTHDTFKAEAKQGVPILDPRSHASLARAFLEEFVKDEEMLAITQFHDEPFALWNQNRAKGSFSSQRFADLLQAIGNWDLFLAFNIIDGCTTGKNGDPVRWLFDQVDGKVETRMTKDDIPSGH